MYEAYFNLTGKPFQLNPDPSFYYGSRGHRRAMAYLEYGLHQNEGFIVVTGEVGAGKTTLIRSLLDKLDPTKTVAATLVSTQVDENDILRMVAAAFGVPANGLDKAGLLLALEARFVALAAAGRRTLLIVDEAQNLSPAAVEELRMLSNFQIEDHALLQSFLVGQPEFRDIMQSPQMKQLRQRVIATYHLGPLDAEETRAYIEHRLKRVGWKGNPKFEDEAFTLIYGYTGGVPRKINSLCDRVLLATFLAERTDVSRELVQSVIAEIQEEFAPVKRDAEWNLLSSGAGAPGRPQMVVPGSVADQMIEYAVTVDLRRIETRLGKLEQSMTMTLNVLNQLLLSVRNDRPGNRDNNGQQTSANKD